MTSHKYEEASSKYPLLTECCYELRRTMSCAARSIIKHLGTSKIMFAEGSGIANHVLLEDFLRSTNMVCLGGTLALRASYTLQPNISLFNDSTRNENEMEAAWTSGESVSEASKEN